LSPQGVGLLNYTTLCELITCGGFLFGIEWGKGEKLDEFKEILNAEQK